MTRPQNPRKRPVRGSALRFIEDSAATGGQNCIVWPFYRDAGGYGKIVLNGKTCRAHRVTLAIATGADQPNMEAAHACGNRGCINPEHLRWATRTENQSDRYLHGTDTRGERHGMSKLTAEQVLEIVELRLTHTQQQVANKFGISRGAVSDIDRGLRWGWLTGLARNPETVGASA